jgi:hypothetical protein
MSPRPRRLALLPAVASALLTSACSSDVVQPIQVGLHCPEQPIRGADARAGEPIDRLIDDFEAGGPMIAAVSGRDGLWVEGDDGTSQMVRWENSMECAVRGTHAAHFFGGGFSDWGANLTSVFRAQPANRAVPYNGTAYGGISFWAAVSRPGAQALDTPVGVTTLDNAWNGGVCTSCMDYYRTTVTLTPDWQRIEIRFSDLRQQGWGSPILDMRRDQLVGFIIWPPAPPGSFDLWIDDVRFEP